ncbi:MAG: hypothetical protein Q9187_002365 [Circinaria calcarea]
MLICLESSDNVFEPESSWLSLLARPPPPDSTPKRAGKPTNVYHHSPSPLLASLFRCAAPRESGWVGATRDQWTQCQRTVGIAAVGYALGRPQIPTATRPTSRKTKPQSSRQGRPNSTAATPVLAFSTPVLEQPHPSSIRLRSGFLRRPKSSSFPDHTIPREESAMIDMAKDEKYDWRDSMFGQTNDAAVDGKALAADIIGNRSGTAKSSWLRRMSTFGSSLNGSPVSTPRPSTPSLSFSHASSAPILSTTETPILPRNKLVKRASSQRLLQGGYADHQSTSKAQVPTLRRPATSHQRSATFQHQYLRDEVEPYQDFGSFRHSIVHDGEDPIEDRSAEVWYPFFRTRNSKLVKEVSSTKRASMGSSGQTESIKRISTSPSELPTLLMATSVCPTAPDEFMQSRETHIETSFTPTRPQTFPAPSTYSSLTPPQTADDQRQRPRSSVSLTEFFPSPSPSTWKMAHPGSFRKKRGSEAAIYGRRVASAPQPSKGRRDKKSSQEKIDCIPQVDRSGSLRNSLADAGLSFEASRTRSPSSPLPSLQRFSAFEIDLPDTVPSYPTSPRPITTSSTSFRTSPVPAMSANAPGQFPVKGKPHRPSGVSLDRASTLVGSDNENSRFSGGEGDELDCQSETVYDSIRTGATGSSHSGVRGPRIESVFDASPPPELLKQNLAALQEKLSNSSVTSWGPNRDFIEEEEESLRTPMKFNGSLVADLPTPSRDESNVELSPELPQFRPQGALSLKRTEEDAFDFDDSQFDEGWAFNDAENPWDNGGLGLIATEAQYPTPLPSLPNLTLEDSTSPESTDHQDQPKSNIFEWSERMNGDRDSQHGSSPRPKTVHGKQDMERDGRPPGRRGLSTVHLRSQSVPLPPDGLSHRGVNTTSKLDAWLLGSKGVSEEWDGDFEFEEPVQSAQPQSEIEAVKNPAASNAILVPQAILERQASVHGQFGQVKELTLLVEELKRLRHQANAQGIIGGQSAELWKEAEGIINLATLDDEDQDFLDPYSPRASSFDFDPFEDDSPASQRYRRSCLVAPRESLPVKKDHSSIVQPSSHSSPAGSNLGTPPNGRPRKQSVAKAKSVLENIHQHRSSLDPPLVDAKTPQKKLPFDTTSLRDLVTRAGVVTRALKEIVRKTNDVPATPDRHLATPPDPPFSQIFQKQSHSPSAKKSPRVMKSTSGKTFLGGSIAGNDNDINGHMKMMTVV